MPAAETTLRLRNDFSELAGAAESISAFLEQNEAPPDAVFAANLAVEELVTNIIKYGYDDEDAHEIAVKLSIQGNVLEIRISDDGHEFNPFSMPEPDTSLPAEERNIGGLGIHFVRNMLDSYMHSWHEGQNVVTVTKKL